MSDPERIWIVGASEGIGAELARAYASRGASLVISARSEDKLQALADEIGAEAVPADVSGSRPRRVQVLLLN